MILHLSNASDSLWNMSAQTRLRRRGWCSCFAPCTQTESCETPHAAPKTILFGIKLCGFRFWQAGFYSKVYTLAYQFRNVHAVYKRPLYPHTFRPGIVGDDIASWIHGKAPAKNTSSKRCICLSCCFALALNKKKLRCQAQCIVRILNKFREIQNNAVTESSLSVRGCVS